MNLKLEALAGQEKKSIDADIIATGAGDDGVLAYLHEGTSKSWAVVIGRFSVLAVDLGPNYICGAVAQPFHGLCKDVKAIVKQGGSVALHEDGSQVLCRKAETK